MHIASHCARLKHVHRDSIKVKKCRAFAWKSQKSVSRFYEGLQNVHLLFMSVSNFCIAIYEGHKQLHLLCVSASTMCITVLWTPEQCASPFYESVKNLHHDLKVWTVRISFTWASQTCAPWFYEGHNKLHSLCMSVSKMSITLLWRPWTRTSPFYGSFKNLHQDLWLS